MKAFILVAALFVVFTAALEYKDYSKFNPFVLLSLHGNTDLITLNMKNILINL